jgi:hypothetical protein
MRTQKQYTVRSIIESARKRPILSALQVLAFLIAFPAFFSMMSFIDAVTPEQAKADNLPLPPGWSAGVMNHGSHYRWWTIQERPVFFVLSVSFLVTSMLFIYGSVYWIWRQSKALQIRRAAFTPLHRPN